MSTEFGKKKREKKKKTNKLIDNGIMEPKMGCGYVLNGIRNVKIIR